MKSWYFVWGKVKIMLLKISKNNLIFMKHVRRHVKKRIVRKWWIILQELNVGKNVKLCSIKLLSRWPLKYLKMFSKSINEMYYYYYYLKFKLFKLNYFFLIILRYYFYKIISIKHIIVNNLESKIRVILKLTRTIIIFFVIFMNHFWCTFFN